MILNTYLLLHPYGLVLKLQNESAMILLLPFFLYIVFSTQEASAANRPISAETKETLKDTPKSYLKGILLSPPAGAIDPQIQTVRQEIMDLILELGGSDVKKLSGNIVVNIYSNVAANAWVQETTTTPEIRELLGFAGNSQPIIEVGITTGLLRKLQFKDELAFVIAHELTHIFEQHIKHKNFSASQQQEIAADLKGLERMLGKYELSAAINGLLIVLHPEKSEATSKLSKINSALEAAATTHHHQGQRLSALQFQIENFRRTRAEAKPRNLIPLSQSMKISSSRQLKQEKDKNFEDIKAVYFKIIDAYLLQNQIYPYLRNRSLPTPKAPLSSIAVLPTDQQWADFISEYINKIQMSDVSKEIKINAFLQMQMILHSLHYSADWWAAASDLQLHQLSRFLVENTSGIDGWKFSSLKKIESSLENKFLLSKIFLAHPKGQAILERLLKISPQWKRFFENQKNLSRYNHSQGLDANGINKELLFYLKIPKGPLAEEYITSITSEIPTLKIEEVEQLKKILYGLDLDTHLTDERKLRLQQAIEQNAFHHNHIKNIIVKIEKTFSNHTSQDERIDFVTDVLKSPQMANLSAQDSKKLESLILKMILVFEMPSEDILSNSEVFWLLCSRILADTSISFTNRIQVFHFMIMMQRTSFHYSQNFTLEMAKNLSQFWTEGTVAENVRLLTQLPPLLIDFEKQLRLSLPANYKRKEPWYLDYIESYYKKRGQKEYAKYLRFIEIIKQVRINALRLFHHYGNEVASLSKISLKDLKQILQALHHSREWGKLYKGNFKIDAVHHRDASMALIKIFTQTISEQPNFSEWHKMYQQIRTLIGPNISWPTEQRQAIENYVQMQVQSLSIKEQFSIIQASEIRNLLSAQEIATILVNHLRQQKLSTLNELHTEVQKIDQQFKLKSQSPDTYRLFRDKVAEQFQLQPQNILEIFKEDQRSFTQKTNIGKYHVRGLSALLEIANGEPPKEQIQLIEFLMGRSIVVPNFIHVTEKDLLQKNSLTSISLLHELYATKEALSARTELERSMVINAFLVGHTGLLSTEAGSDALIEHLLKNISLENKEFANILIKSLFAAEGINRSIFLSYTLAQHSTDSSLSEAIILKSLLDSYGVPGVKLAQYLAFTKEFKKFGSILETYQDAAIPISHYEMLMLLRERLGTSWNSGRYHVLKIIGSGSVNIAIEYVDLETNQSKVITIARKDIEVKTQEDFRRFHLLLLELSQNPQNRHQFEFVVGLMNIIQQSVNLEFNKPHAYEMQTSVQNLYHRTVNGWKVRTVNAFDLQPMAIFMEKAPGIGARKILATNPEIYKSAMGALLKVEEEVLRGVNETNNLRPLPLHANPDLHDGQVLIDIENRQVTFLDFGQAEYISNLERELAIDLLRIISGAESISSAKRLLTYRLEELQLLTTSIDDSSVEKALQRQDRMDRFIRLISSLERQGIKLPLASIHWVFAANRLVRLGEKIDISVETSYRNLITARKVGLPISVYNTVINWTERLQPSNLCRSLFGD